MGTLQPVGRVSKLFGTKGEVLLNLYDTFPVGFNMEEPLFVVIDGLAVPLFLERFERRGRSGALAVFADLDTASRAGELAGLEFSVEKGQPEITSENLSEAEGDGFYLENFVGFTACFLGDGRAGTIADFIDGDNPLFLLEVGGLEVYVPAVDELIASFNPDTREITFDLPDGLLELYLG